MSTNDQIKVQPNELEMRHDSFWKMVHIPAHRDRPFRLNVTACSGLT